MSSGKVDRFYFFASEHVPPGNYNEVHPCSIVRTKWREQGWYLNSFYKISIFKGYKIGSISFGLTSGYRSYKIPYIAYHWDGGFTLPLLLLPGSKLKYIKCTYGDRTIKSSFKMMWNKWVK